MPETEHTEEFKKLSEIIAFVAGMALFLVFIYQILPILSPFILVAAILFLLYPARHHLYVRRMMWLAVFLFLLWFFHALIGTLAPFIIAFLLAYLLNPLVEVFEQRNIPRWLSSLLIIVVFLGAIISSIVLLIPTLVGQFRGIIEGLTVFAWNTVDQIKQGQLLTWLENVGIPTNDLRDMIANQLPTRFESIVRALLEGALGFLTSVSTIITQVFGLIIIPFTTFYLLMDYPAILQKLRSLIPVPRRESVTVYIAKIDDMLGHYLRGILLLALIQGIATTTGLFLIGIHYALVLGILTGILNLIPYIGFYSCLVLSAIVALFSGDPVVGKFIGVIILYVGLNVLENMVLAPKIVGKKVGVHPILLILSLVVFGYFLGFVGLVIAVPMTAVILMFVKMWEEYNTSTAVAETK
ncbi:MAG: AI-2E family transporter [Ignavibacteriae bacterium]|nr:AI-2E family transporter [Ignavibacteriota bacterium]